MQVARWGNSLAVRIPAPLAAKLGLTEGKEIALRAKAASTAGFGQEQSPLKAQGEAASTVRVGKWGNSLGLRLPKAIAQELGLAEGINVSLVEGADGMVDVSKVPEPARKRSRAEALAAFRQSRGIFTGSVRFPREDLQLRGPDVRD